MFFLLKNLRGLELIEKVGAEITVQKIILLGFILTLEQSID